MFASIFNQLLQEKRVTAYAVAKATGISQGTMNQYKNGKTVPGNDNLSKIAKYFEVSTDYLLGNSEYRTNTAEQFSITAEKAITNLTEWLEDHGFEVGRNESDNGSGVEWYISKAGKSCFFEENEFKAESVMLSQLLQTPSDTIYADWALRKLNPPILNNDEKLLLDIYRSLDPQLVHEFMVMVHRFGEDAESEDTKSQSGKATG